MNRLPAEITRIETADALSIVDFSAFGDTFTSVVIETPETVPYLRSGNRVTLVFKETELALAKNFSGQISLRNHFAGTVIAVESGKLLSKITLDYHGVKLVSIITTRSTRALNIQPGDAVVGMVKTNEIAILAETGDPL